MKATNDEKSIKGKEDERKERLRNTFFDNFQKEEKMEKQKKGRHLEKHQK